MQDQTVNAASKGITHVIFIIRLARVTGGSSFTSFQGHPWLCTHIDDLTTASGINRVLSNAFTKPIHKFFEFLIKNDSENPNTFKVRVRIKENIQIAMAKTVTYSTYTQVEGLIGILLSLVNDIVEDEGIMI